MTVTGNQPQPSSPTVATYAVTNPAVRLRFAPSPTGYLHVGGARTALFNWLYARHLGGTFVLRIEDTDVARSTQESVQAILDGMSWLGLNWDEGPGVGGPYGPYFQMQRLDTYETAAKQLLNSGHAYHCFCSKEELDELREAATAKGEAFSYPGRCRNLLPDIVQKYIDEGRKPVVRFQVPATGETVLDDLVHGPITFRNDQLDDFVIVKSDGVPTYNFAVVIDDALMKISHVLRGDDHVSNTPKQILIYQALGYPLPRFGHIPMILGSDRARLSKRHGATSVIAYDEAGYLSDAFVNYLSRLGWGHGDQEIFTRQELIAFFDIPAINKTAAVFDHVKLDWVNSQWMKQTPADELACLLRPRLAKRGWPVEAKSDAWLAALVDLTKERTKTLEEMADYAKFFFDVDLDYDAESVEKFLTAETRPILEGLLAAFSAETDWTAAIIEGIFKDQAIQMGLKAGGVIQPARVALAGSKVSPGMYETAELMGKDLVLKRLRHALSLIPAPATP
ncbi:Glutamate--tRNA ligase [compost metagenome]